MKEVVTLHAAGTPPDRATVLRSQGIPAHCEPRPRVLALVDQALDLYAALTAPRAIYAEVERPRFEAIYRGDGRNAHRTPLEEILPRAGRLALFAATLGGAVSEEIQRLFERNEPALACMLDAVASNRADRAADLVSRRFLDRLGEEGSQDPATRVLAYSPGYCGWHITGQRRLFEYLDPGEIGVTLRTSCLMHPLKSVSGVLVAGSRDAHEFDNDYDFCDVCTTYPCRERIASLAAGHGLADEREGSDGDPWRDCR